METNGIAALVRQAYEKKVSAEEKVSSNNFMAGVLSIGGVALTILFAHSCMIADFDLSYGIKYSRDVYSNARSIFGGLSVISLVVGFAGGQYFAGRAELARPAELKAKREFEQVKQQYPDHVPRGW